MKSKAAQEVGITYTHVGVPAQSTADQIVNIVQDLNANEDVNAILVQLPLGEHISSADERLVTEAVSPTKDVDG